MVTTGRKVSSPIGGRWGRKSTVPDMGGPQHWLPHPKNGSVLLKDKDMGAANSNASVVHKSTKRDKPTGMKEAQLVIAPLKRTSAVRMPSAGERCVIVRGRRPDLIGRQVTVDEVLKSKCHVHYVEGGERKEIRGLQLTSVHGLGDAGTDPEWEWRAKLPKEEQQQVRDGKCEGYG